MSDPKKCAHCGQPVTEKYFRHFCGKECQHKWHVARTNTRKYHPLLKPYIQKLTGADVPDYAAFAQLILYRDGIGWLTPSLVRPTLRFDGVQRQGPLSIDPLEYPLIPANVESHALLLLYDKEHRMIPTPSVLKRIEVCWNSRLSLEEIGEQYK